MTDTRFFAGYTWVSESADCRRGLCIRGNAAEAAARYVALTFRYWHQRNLTHTVYTLQDAKSLPVCHIR